MDCIQGKWRESSRILQQIHGFIVFARPPPVIVDAVESSATTTIQQQDHDTVLQDCLEKASQTVSGSKHPPLLLKVDHLQAISSSQVRASTDTTLWKQIVPPSVLEYVLEHKLYAIGRQAGCTDKRYV